jgi:hypothetical protein
MRWMKVAAVAVGALIVFMVVGTVIHLLMEAVFLAIVVAAVAIAIKVAAGRRKLPRGRTEYGVREPRQAPKVTAPPVTPARSTAHSTIDVDDDLARLKREMGG